MTYVTSHVSGTYEMHSKFVLKNDHCLVTSSIPDLNPCCKKGGRPKMIAGMY